MYCPKSLMCLDFCSQRSANILGRMPPLLCIVYVLPDPVCPYANRHTFYPFKESCTKDFATTSNTSSYVASFGKILSYLKLSF